MCPKEFNQLTFKLSRNCLFEHINSLQYYVLTRKCGHLLYTQTSSLTYVAYPWSVPCECAMKQNKRGICNYLQIRFMRGSPNIPLEDFSYSFSFSVMDITPERELLGIEFEYRNYYFLKHYKQLSKNRCECESLNGLL